MVRLRRLCDCAAQLLSERCVVIDTNSAQQGGRRGGAHEDPRGAARVPALPGR